jgi:hypothetical protein
VIEVGQKVKFDPFKEHTGFASEGCKGKNVTGTVVFVNEPHKWFLVEYTGVGGKQHTSFKFYEIGKAVKVCG